MPWPLTFRALCLDSEYRAATLRPLASRFTPRHLLQPGIPASRTQSSVGVALVWGDFKSLFLVDPYPFLAAGRSQICRQIFESAFAGQERL